MFQAWNYLIAKEAVYPHLHEASLYYCAYMLSFLIHIAIGFLNPNLQLQSPDPVLGTTMLKLKCFII